MSSDDDQDPRPRVSLQRAPLLAFDTLGHELMAMAVGDETWVALEGVHAALGLDPLHTLPELAGAMEVVRRVHTSGRPRRMAMLRVKDLTTWLETIAPARLTAKGRAALELFKGHLAWTIEDMFFGGLVLRVSRPSGPDSEMAS